MDFIISMGNEIKDVLNIAKLTVLVCALAIQRKPIEARPLTRLIGL